MKKRYWIIFGYLVVVLLFALALDPIFNLIGNIQGGDSKTVLWWLYYPTPAVEMITAIILGFGVIMTALSVFFYLKYRRRGKTELMKGFRITSIISVIGLVYLIIEALFA